MVENGYPHRYHCYRCGKNLGLLTPPAEVKCRRCGTVCRFVLDTAALTPLPGDPRLATKA